ncbi:MAG: HEAT repeat domain-containing protein [Deltaproteobacteria bacterium]|nr:HEAT repeat domain-containing protein [Deltaproteobacteria bacterium]
MGAALVWIGLVLVAAACDPASPEERKNAVAIVSLQDEASSVAKGVRFSQRRARQYLAKALSRSSSFLPVEDVGPSVYRAELRIALASEREAGGGETLGVYRAVQVELTLKRPARVGGEELSAMGREFLVQNPESFDREDGFDAVLELAIERAVELMELQVEIRSMTPSRLREALKKEKPEVRLYALRSLRERKLPSLVPDMIALLADEDDEIMLEAVGALVAQGDRRAVKPLIRICQEKDPVFVLQIITALAELGGPEARGYLFTLAAGHSSEDIRVRAAEALRQVQQSGPGSAPVELALPEPAMGSPPRTGSPPERGVK